MRDVKVLDCTLRDGGYYNRWDFEPGLVRDYLDAMARSGVDLVEVGFRNPHWPGFVGKLAYSTAEQLSDLAGKHPGLGVMTDTKALLAKDGALDPKVLGSLYGADGDAASFVRLATLPKDLKAAADAAKWLAGRGYKVFVNLMQASSLGRAELERLAALVRGSPLEALYLADSFGSLYPETTRAVVQEAKAAFGLPIGFHAHDNLGLANANALAAAEAGATWIDGTVMGMGRGAGNARTENLVPIFRGLGRQDLVPAALGRLVDHHFRPLQQRYEWGPSLAFALSALAGVHPTYAQKLLAGNRYSSAEVLHALESLHAEPARGSYSDAVLLRGRTAANGWAAADGEGALPALRKRVGPVRDALVLGAGAGLERYADGVRAAAARAGVVVLTNAAPAPPGAAAALRAVIHRRHAPAVAACGDEAPVVHPFAEAEAASLFAGKEALQVPCALSAAPERSGAIRVPSDVVGMYAIEVAARLGAQRIRLAGFDGYGTAGTIEKDPDSLGKEALLNHEMNSYLASLRAQPGPPVVSITPTWYDLPLESPYAPL
jgi:4-hydroxy 2-oxovalerate aldolase